jgi:protein AFG1
MRAIRTTISSGSCRRFLYSTQHRAQLPSLTRSTRCLNPRGQAFSSSLAVHEHTNFAEPPVIHTPNAKFKDTTTPYTTLKGGHLCCIWPPPSDVLMPDQHSSPLQRYHNLVQSGALRSDNHQTRIIETLQQLHDKLIDYNPPLIPEPPSSTSLVSLNLTYISPKLTNYPSYPDFFLVKFQ